eukprot:m.31108 g.31108  ORF g.31108 m.31108 type:complete len:316 (+) comp16397_c2_seq1:75-1022(+)
MIQGSQNKVQKGKFSFAVRLIALLAATTVSTGAKPAPAACNEEPDSPHSITKMSSKSKVRSFSTAAELSFELGKAVAQTQAEARANPSGRTNDPQQFTIAISGGSLPKLLAAGVVGDNVDPSVASIDWKNWHVFFVDERFVPLDHDDSNFKACQDKLFSKVPIPASQVYAINPNAANVEAAADAYKEKLVHMFGTSCLLPETPPVFDLVLLGMGPDGHTASLFPGHALLNEHSKIMAHIDASPKPPPQRITFTYRTINAATKTFFVCTGAGKAPNLKKVLTSDPTDDDALPSARVTGQITWFVDDAASADYSASL